jgi:tetratricopeptide (TPR) repeat protein
VKTGEDGASFFSNLPAALCYPGRFKKGINWFVPNRACLESWARASGLEIQDFKMVKDHYPDQRYACRLVKTRTAEEEHPVYARSGTLENPCVIERRARLCRETGDREQARSLYARGMEILREKREKTPLDIYRLGSFQQNVGQYPEAIVSFESLIDSAGVEPTLQAGAHFHLGEIHAACGERSRAKKYFLRCLEINPGHKKARERYQSL